MIVVTEAASDPTLLSLAEVSDATGGKVTDPATLQRLNARASELLAGACGLERAGTAMLTLRQETLTETLRLRCAAETLVLLRKPIVAVLSAMEGTTALDLDYDIEQAGPRTLARISGGVPSCWAAGKVVISYTAGYAVVPPGLKELASKLITTLSAERGRDPSLRRLQIEGVSEREWWVGSADDPLITSEIMEGLASGGYLIRNMVS